MIFHVRMGAISIKELKFEFGNYWGPFDKAHFLILFNILFLELDSWPIGCELDIGCVAIDL